MKAEINSVHISLSSTTLHINFHAMGIQLKNDMYKPFSHILKRANGIKIHLTATIFGAPIFIGERF